MIRGSIRTFFVSTVFLGLIFLPGACTGTTDHVSTFLLRSDTANINDISDELITEISSQLTEANALGEGYPILGYVELTPDASDSAVQTAQCVSSQQSESDNTLCILLNEEGDFLQARTITWESQAFHMYRVHVAPKGLFVEVNPVKDYVGLDVFLREPALLQAVDQAIRDAATEIGARPFRP